MIILSLLSGVALFLFGMTLMGDGLQRIAGNSLERTLYKLTSTPIKGVLLGALVTAVIQSSSATTVMVVGFVNSGMMKVIQAIGVIMGANIGTSITGWILCLSYIDGGSGIATLLSTATISAIVAIVGIILKKFTKHSKYHHVGDIMLGFAILMMGMQTMSGAVAPLRQSEQFVSLLTAFKNPLLGILVGTVFTAILQSSSASIGILQALSMTGVITFGSAFPIVLGIGIGAAAPVLLSSIGTNKNGKRTALVYLIDDMMGMIIWGSVFYIAHAIVHFTFMDLTMTPVLVAALNSVYRILTVVVLMPFIKVIEKSVFMLVKDSDEDLEEQADFDLLEDRFLPIPQLALSQSHRAINGMATTACNNISRSINLLTTYTEESFNKVVKKEALLDKYEDKLGTYLMQLSKQSMNTQQTKETSKFLHSLGDYERLGDHAMNIAYCASEINEKHINFSEEAMAEISTINAAALEIVNLTVDAFKGDNVDTAVRVEPLREWIGELCSIAKTHHISRLQTGTCSIEHGFVLNDLMTNYERIAAHCSNIAAVVIECDTADLESHQFIKDMRHNRTGFYTECLDHYKVTYKF